MSPVFEEIFHLLEVGLRSGLRVHNVDFGSFPRLPEDDQRHQQAVHHRLTEDLDPGRRGDHAELGEELEVVY